MLNKLKFYWYILFLSQDDSCYEYLNCTELLEKIILYFVFFLIALAICSAFHYYYSGCAYYNFFPNIFSYIKMLVVLCVIYLLLYELYIVETSVPGAILSQNGAVKIFYILLLENKQEPGFDFPNSPEYELFMLFKKNKLTALEMYLYVYNFDQGPIVRDWRSFNLQYRLISVFVTALRIEGLLLKRYLILSSITSIIVFFLFF